MSDDVITYATKRLDELSHVGFTMDRQGGITAAKTEGEREALKEVLSLLDAEYDHRPADCVECQKEQQVLDEFTDL